MYCLCEDIFQSRKFKIAANNFIINNSWDVDGNYKDVSDTVGIMAYGENTGDELEVSFRKLLPTF